MQWLRQDIAGANRRQSRSSPSPTCADGNVRVGHRGEELPRLGARPWNSRVERARAALPYRGDFFEASGTWPTAAKTRLLGEESLGSSQSSAFCTMVKLFRG